MAPRLGKRIKARTTVWNADWCFVLQRRRSRTRTWVSACSIKRTRLCGERSTEWRHASARSGGNGQGAISNCVVVLNTMLNDDRTLFIMYRTESQNVCRAQSTVSMPLLVFVHPLRMVHCSRVAPSSARRPSSD